MMRKEVREMERKVYPYVIIKENGVEVEIYKGDNVERTELNFENEKDLKEFIEFLDKLQELYPDEFRVAIERDLREKLQLDLKNIVDLELTNW
jgi:hypothetical protein